MNVVQRVTTIYEFEFYRQLRNRDAAVRSRERKKMYVKDLEMKSKFLEGECRRLGRLLQCYCAENQALRFSLQMGGASGVSMTKQESAVLLLGTVIFSFAPYYFIYSQMNLCVLLVVWMST